MINSMYIDEIEQVISHHWEKHYCSPTIRHIAKTVGIPSTSLTSYLIARLVQDKGYHRVPGKAASIAPPWIVSAIEKAKEERRGLGVGHPAHPPIP